jgi:NAD(P)H-flavin reductase
MPGPIHLYFGVRAERDVYGEAELREWRARHANLRVHVVLAEPPNGALPAGHRCGMVTDAVAADFADLTGFHAYLAGPPAMVDAASEMLRGRGVAARDMHADAFYSAPAARPAGAQAVTRQAT